MIITKREEEEMEKKFIAYEGVEIDPSSIYRLLGKEWGYGVELRTEIKDNLLFIETFADPILIGSNLFFAIVGNLLSKIEFFCIY